MSDYRDYQYARLKEQETAYDLPLRGVIKEVLGETETVKVSSFGTTGFPEFAVRHPFLGINSWIRAMPEAGTTVLTQRRGDLEQQEIFGYISNKLAAVARIALKDRTIPFRILHAGEIDLMSRGMSSMYLGDNGDLELRGGLVAETLSQSTLEHTSLAPTFHRRLGQHDPVFLGHEERFGVVRRLHPIFPKSMQRIIQKLDTTFPVEYSRWLTTTDILNRDLVTLQEGSAVYDVLGLETRQTSTQRTLRHKKTYYATLTGNLTVEIDEDLNIFIKNTSLAPETKIDFGVANETTIKTKKLAVSGLDQASFDFVKSISMKSLKVHVNAPDVQFGAQALQPAILGTNLTSTILTPLLSALAAFFNIMGNDPVLLSVGSPSPVGAQAAAQVVNQMIGSVSSILSTQVKLTA